MLGTEYENSKLNLTKSQEGSTCKMTYSGDAWNTKHKIILNEMSTTRQSTLEPNILTNIRCSNIDDTSRRPSLQS
jgi:hypothetical protein